MVHVQTLHMRIPPNNHAATLLCFAHCLSISLANLGAKVLALLTRQYWLCYHTHPHWCCTTKVHWYKLFFFGLFCRSPLCQQFQLSVTEHVSGTFFGRIQTLRIILQQFSQCWTTTAGNELYSSLKMKMCSPRLLLFSIGLRVTLVMFLPLVILHAE